MSELQVEIISESLRELQQEKKRLENVLQNERAKRKEMGAKLNLVNAQYSNVSERLSKISATRDISKQRMKESEELVNKLQKVHADKQRIIEDMKEKIELESKRKDERSNELSQKLDELAKQFFNARGTFSEDNLQYLQQEYEIKISESSNAAYENKKLVEALMEKFREYMLEVQDGQADDDGSWPTLEELQNALNIFQTEEALVTSCDENYTEELKAATGRVEMMKAELKRLNMATDI
eukprot:Seg420.8 transcript_id=Seg420.8/GoldUCD/mRNA.D3Y31 product="hypothetical protein" protein_id=Seg420.8/GoldUCD/D3Y31